MRARKKERRAARGILSQLRTSGLSQREFAEREGVPLSTLTYWLRRERLEQELVKETALVAITTPSGGTPTFVVEVKGFRIEVPRDVTVEEWRRLQEAWAS